MRISPTISTIIAVSFAFYCSNRWKQHALLPPTSLTKHRPSTSPKACNRSSIRVLVALIEKRRRFSFSTYLVTTTTSYDLLKIGLILGCLTLKDDGDELNSIHRNNSFTFAGQFFIEHEPTSVVTVTTPKASIAVFKWDPKCKDFRWLHIRIVPPFV